MRKVNKIGEFRGCVNDGEFEKFNGSLKKKYCGKCKLKGMPNKLPVK